MWDNVDAPETQVEDASAGAGKQTHLTDVLVMLYNFRVANLWCSFLSNPEHCQMATAAPRGLSTGSFVPPAPNQPDCYISPPTSLSCDAT